MTITGTGHITRVGADTPSAVLFREPFAPSTVPYLATSSTSHATIASFGSYQFAIQPGMAFQKGARVRAISDPTGSWIEGVVVSYSGTQLTIKPDRAHIPAAGPYTNWSITISGEVEINKQILNSGEILDAKVVESNFLGAVTFNLHTLISGGDPSPTNPIIFQAPSGRTRVIQEPVSLTIPYLATLGVAASQPFRLWIVLIDDVGFQARLAVGQTRDPATNSVAGFQGRAIVSTQLPGNSSGVFYSDKVMTNVSYVVLGFVDYDNGLATPGIWNISPNRFVYFATGNPLPGDVMSITAKQVSSLVTASALIPVDDSIPQLSEGNQLFDYDVTPLSRMSVITVESQVNLSSDAGVEVVAGLFRSDRSNAMVTSWAPGGLSPLQLQATTFLGHTNTTLFSVRAGRGTASGANAVLNGTAAGGAFYGGTFNSFIKVTERMT